MQVILHIVAFSLQTGGSGRPVLTKGKRPNTLLFTPMKRTRFSQHSICNLTP